MKSSIQDTWPVYERGPIDRVFDASAVAIVGGHTLLAFWTLPGLPSEIPVHYDLAGRPDRWGSREFIFLLPLISAVITVLLAVLSRFPRSLNYPFTLTAQSSAYQSRTAIRLLQTLSLEFQLLFGFLTLDIVSRASGHPLMGWWLLPAFLVCIFGSIGFYLVRASKSVTPKA